MKKRVKEWSKGRAKGKEYVVRKEGRAVCRSKGKGKGALFKVRLRRYTFRLYSHP